MEEARTLNPRKDTVLKSQHLESACPEKRRPNSPRLTPKTYARYHHVHDARANTHDEAHSGPHRIDC
jgi:hypothetical protein